MVTEDVLQIQEHQGRDPHGLSDAGHAQVWQSARDTGPSVKPPEQKGKAASQGKQGQAEGDRDSDCHAANERDRAAVGGGLIRVRFEDMHEFETIDEKADGAMEYLRTARSR